MDGETLFKRVKYFSPFEEYSRWKRNGLNDELLSKLSVLYSRFYRLPKRHFTSEKMIHDAQCLVHYFSGDRHFFLYERPQAEMMEEERIVQGISLLDKRNPQFGLIYFDRMLDIKSMRVDLEWNPLSVGQLLFHIKNAKEVRF